MPRPPSLLRRFLTRVTSWYSWREDEEADARVDQIVRRAEVARREAAIRAAYEDADRKVHR